MAGKRKSGHDGSPMPANGSDLASKIPAETTSDLDAPPNVLAPLPADLSELIDDLFGQSNLSYGRKFL